MWKFKDFSATQNLRENNFALQNAPNDIFLSVRFYVKSKLSNLESPNVVFNTFRGSKSWFSWIYVFSQGLKFTNWTKSESRKLEKMAISKLDFLQLISRKKLSARKMRQISTLWGKKNFCLDFCSSIQSWLSLTWQTFVHSWNFSV